MSHGSLSFKLVKYTLKFHAVKLTDYKYVSKPDDIPKYFMKRK